MDEPLKLACESDTANLLPASARPFYLDLMNLIGTLTQLNTPAEIIDMTLEQFYGDYLVSHYDGADLRKEDLKALANFAAQETITPPCVIPEPTTICLLGLGVLGLLRKRRA